MALFDNVLPEGHNARSASVLALSIVTPFLVTWLFTSFRARVSILVAGKAAPGSKRPPALPSAVPLLGHIIAFMQDGHGFLSNAV